MEKDNFSIMGEVRKIWADKAILDFYWCGRLYLANDRYFDTWVRATLAFYGKQMFRDEGHARQVVTNCENYLIMKGYDIIPTND